MSHLQRTASTAHLYRTCTATVRPYRTPSALISAPVAHRLDGALLQDPKRVGDVALLAQVLACNAHRESARAWGGWGGVGGEDTLLVAAVVPRQGRAAVLPSR